MTTPAESLNTYPFGIQSHRNWLQKICTPLETTRSTLLRLHIKAPRAINFFVGPAVGPDPGAPGAIYDFWYGRILEVFGAICQKHYPGDSIEGFALHFARFEEDGGEYFFLLFLEYCRVLDGSIFNVHCVRLVFLLFCGFIYDFGFVFPFLIQ